MSGLRYGYSHAPPEGFSFGVDGEGTCADRKVIKRMFIDVDKYVSTLDFTLPHPVFVTLLLAVCMKAVVRMAYER